jgi:hypothetical protein
LPLYSRASMHAAGASGYFLRNSSLNFSDEHSTFVNRSGSIGFEAGVVEPQPTSNAATVDAATKQLVVFTWPSF